jgi:hypothetical protein
MIYFFTNRKNIKIGYTKNKVENRLRQLNTGSDIPLFCLGYIDGGRSKEKELHKLFSSDRLRDNGEWFSPSDRLIDYINTHNQKPNTYVEYDKDNDLISDYLCISTL